MPLRLLGLDLEVPGLGRDGGVEPGRGSNHGQLLEAQPRLSALSVGRHLLALLPERGVRAADEADEGRAVARVLRLPRQVHGTASSMRAVRIDTGGATTTVDEEAHLAGGTIADIDDVCHDLDGLGRLHADTRLSCVDGDVIEVVPEEETGHVGLPGLGALRIERCDDGLVDLVRRRRFFGAAVAGGEQRERCGEHVSVHAYLQNGLSSGDELLLRSRGGFPGSKMVSIYEQHIATENTIAIDIAH